MKLLLLVRRDCVARQAAAAACLLLHETGLSWQARGRGVKKLWHAPLHEPGQS